MIKHALNYKKNTNFENFYIGLRTFYLLLITLSIFGIGVVSPEIMSYIQITIKLVISLYLIVTFNLFRKKTKINLKEQSIVYSAGIYLFLSTSVGTFILNYLKNHPYIYELPIVRKIKKFRQN